MSSTVHWKTLRWRQDKERQLISDGLSCMLIYIQFLSFSVNTGNTSFFLTTYFLFSLRNLRGPYVCWRPFTACLQNMYPCAFPNINSCRKHSMFVWMKETMWHAIDILYNMLLYQIHLIMWQLADKLYNIMLTCIKYTPSCGKLLINFITILYQVHPVMCQVTDKLL